MTLPTLFLSHGSPMHAIEPTTASRAWQELGRTLPKPRAILIVSGHWESSVPLVTGSANPQTIHDFGGFPAALYQIEYPARGDPDLAARAVALLKHEGIAAGVDGNRGLDHGAWVPLRWMYPDASVPVVQLSLQTELGPAHHLRVGRALASLGNEDVLVVGSGHTTHNLGDWMRGRDGGTPLPYAEAFARWLGEKLEGHDVEALLDYRHEAPGAVRAHPTEEHFLPLFVALGAAGDAATPEPLLRGFEGNALALDSYLFRPRG